MVAFRRSLTLRSRLILASAVLALGSIDSGATLASHGGHGGAVSSGGMHSVHPGHMGGAAHQLDYHPGSSYYGGYGGFGVGGLGVGYGVGSYWYNPPLTGYGVGLAPFVAPAFPMGVAPFGMNGGFGGGGLNLPMPPQGMVNPVAAPRPRASNPAKARELTEVGDRSFRGHNIKRAEDKYKLAVKADPTSPTPHVHLAQVSVARGNYAAAADHLRDAVTVAGDGAWLINTPDIQAIFGEPADFARQVARLETHLQANPNDRDAWFVLGAETYLSGRPRQAFDVFQRLTDRRVDEATTAFLDASRPRPAAN